MITLKQLKGMTVDFDDESIQEIKRIHEEQFNKGLIHETPPSSFYESALALQRPYLDKTVEQQINEINGITSNLVIGDEKTSNVADEPVDVIKEDWVKLVEPSGRPAPEPVADPE
jgi:hypothetical protein